MMIGKSSQFLALVAEAKKKDMETKEDEPLVLDGCRGRSDAVVTREGRTWFIEVDTCFGHSGERLSIVPGIERRAEESESEEDEEVIGPEDRARLKALFLSAGQKTRLLTIASGMMKAPPKKIAQITMVQLMEQDDDFEPALNIPMFAPLRHGPPPSIEVNEEEAVEQQRTRQQKRPSVFDSVTSAATGSAGGIDMNALAIIQSEDEEEDDEDSPELLEGFGQGPEKRTVKVRKFVRRNKFLKKVFRRSSSTDMKDVSISDDHFDN
jgi:hypothetical protein